ncbi:MAG TPA: hypothetical protein PKD53_13200 [Chloroflexaceae bacterium]|nr:hypothetical protein [Chloroflexaceae bacterium]
MNLRPLLALLVALGAGLAHAPARAQEQPPVTIEVRAGYDGEGRYRVGHWFPATVVVANDGADLRATVAWTFPGSGEASFQYEVDLPRGARKAVPMPLVTDNSDRTARVTVRAGGADLALARVPLAPIGFGEVAVGVISADRSLLNSLAAATLAPNTTTVVTRLDPALLPDDATVLAGLDAIVIHDLATATLSEAQRAALATWARLGGQLLVGGGPQADQTAPGLAELLPVEVGELRPSVPTDSLGTLASRRDLAGSVPTTTASTVTLRDGARSLDGEGLLTAWDLGAGQVVFAAFDLAALRAWGGEAELWEQVLRAEPQLALGASFRGRGENLLRDALELPALRLPSTGVLLLLMGVYIVVVGPVNFLVLRRLRRVELAWVTTPLLVAGFTGAAYGASFVLRGTAAQTTELAIVQAFESAPGGKATSFQAIFSPQRRTYRLDFDPATLVTPGTLDSFQLAGEPVTADGATTGVRELLIDVSALRTLLVEAPTSQTPAVASSLEVDGGSGVRGELRLEGTLGLSDAMVVFRDSAQELGELRPGDSATVSLRATARNFPDQITADAGTVINRARVLRNLFSFDRFTRGGPTFQGEKGLPEQDGVYLLGWAPRTTVEGRIDGAPGRRQGETLYIIRLGA